jgi:hypothetical protein
MVRVGSVALLVEDEVLLKLLKLELRIAFAAVSELKMSKNKPLATSFGDIKTRHLLAAHN